MKSPILGQSYVARSINEADNRMVNMFPEITPDGGKEAAYLMRAPGLRLLATVGNGPVRGMWTYNGQAYVVSGTSLYELNNDYTSTLIGTIEGSDPVSIADNGTQMFIAASPLGYIYNQLTNELQQISDIDFPGSKMVGFLDGYFVFSEPNSQKFWITSLYEGTEIDPLDFASAEGSPDGIVSLFCDHRELWLFGTQSVEVWYNAGTPDFPFQRIQGAYNEIGCAAAFSVAKLDNTLFWLGADARGKGVIYRANGYNAQRVSTHAVEYSIQGYGDISDAVAFTYQQDGHAFYVINFPTLNRTWVYDVATGAWHERAGFSDGSFIRYRPNCQMAWNDSIVVGDFQNGKVYALDLDVYSDAGLPQKWLRSWRALPTGQNNLKRTAHHSLQLDCETGVGLDGYDYLDQQEILCQNGPALLCENGSPLILQQQTLVYTTGVNPQVMLRWSDDGGHTWSNEHWRSMGRIGEYGYRTIWRRLGMTLKLRDRVYEVSGSDPVKLAIMGAELELSGTNA